MHWETIDTDESEALELSRALSISSVSARLLIQRGISSRDSAEDFLRPRLTHLDDPFALSGLRCAVDRIEQAIEQGQDVVVFGDYDVDGITSTVQLVKMLQHFDLEPRYCVPKRLEEGYGLSREAIDRVFAGQRPDLFIALDCGTNAHEPIRYLQGLGVDVIVVDHHQAKGDLPEGIVLVNPHVCDEGTEASWKELCTAGLVFKLLHGLSKSRRAAGDLRAESIQLKDFLDLVALGTVADLVPLVGENRILAWYGLQHLRANERVGIRALAEVSGIESPQEMTSGDISFRLGPRINACGRIADASLPIELFLGGDYRECRAIAAELDSLNRERQAIERSITEEAESRALRDFADAPGIVLFDQDWHPGVVGIVASRVSRRFNKPCVILGAEGDVAKGSGRSVADVNLVEAFHSCDHLLDHWGGHPMAAGVSLSAANVAAFIDCFTGTLSRLYPQGLPEASLSLSAWLDPEQLTEDILGELERMHPYGQANAEPIFGLRSVVLEERVIPFGARNLRFRIPTGRGRSVAGIAWGVDEPIPVSEPVDLAIRFSWNCWRGKRSPQATLIDWKRSE